MNRFFAWELCPRREFQSCHQGRHTAHRSPQPGSASGDFTCLSGAFFYLAAPPPCKASHPPAPDIYGEHQRPPPALCREAAALPPCLLWAFRPHSGQAGTPSSNFQRRELMWSRGGEGHFHPDPWPQEARQCATAGVLCGATQSEHTHTLSTDEETEARLESREKDSRRRVPRASHCSSLDEVYPGVSPGTKSNSCSEV